MASQQRRHVTLAAIALGFAPSLLFLGRLAEGRSVPRARNSLGTSALAMERTEGCYATRSSLTPPAWSTPPEEKHPIPQPGLRLVRDVPLPGPPNRFDYQSIDGAGRRLYISHMNAGEVIVYDVDSARVLHVVRAVQRATGVWAVPSHHQVYASAAGTGEVVVFDDRTFGVIARVGGIKFPDGIAYAPNDDKVFVSDEMGRADVVIDAKTPRTKRVIALGGEAGNTHYDSVSHCVLVAVQTSDEVVAIDPNSERVVARYATPGIKAPHGFVLDESRRLAFVTGEGNAMLGVLDLRSLRMKQRLRVGDDPDVVAWDPAWRRLYVASESGILSSFLAVGDTLLPLGDVTFPKAHSVSVDPLTHRVYVPLENVGGRPMLRVLTPAP